tara:strand:+ start:901 stop:1554 length:654 start_codon:yes stop_codon:yes gene_type:complete
MIPTIIVDNFFTNPNKVLEIYKNCQFGTAGDGSWPGERSKPLHETHFEFFQFLHKKIFTIIYPGDHEFFDYNATTHFQRVNGDKYFNEGWVHNDPNEITAIVYLSEHENCGTSFWERKEYQELIHIDKKEQVYLNKLSFDEEKKFLEENNNQFKKNLDVNSKFNRLILFDAKKFHSANSFYDEKIKGPRLTLITFIDTLNIRGKTLKSPILENLRID